MYKSLVLILMMTWHVSAHAAEVVIPGYVLDSFSPSHSIPDPIREARVLALANRTFPNLSSQLAASELLSRASENPSMRGNLRGRLAEEVFHKNYQSEGWEPVRSKIAPENDFKRRLPNGTMEGAQVKVHAKVGDYIRSMKYDSKAERFVVPDDHYAELKRDFEVRRQGALRGGDAAKADYYTQQSARLMKLGKNFSELDNAIEASARHYRAIAVATARAGKALPFIGIALAVVDGSIQTVEFANGKTNVSDYLQGVSKVAVGGVASWYVATTASNLVLAAGATGLVPVIVVVVAGGATYLVVDWTIDYTAKSLTYIPLSDKELEMIWPANTPRSLRRG
jgi:hypothetical protein